MATQEKLLKSLEILKNLSSLNPAHDPSKKKEKIQHCHVVTDAISNSTIKIAPNFLTYLSKTIEVLLQLCDDHESDVRMTAGDCLNRIIRALNDGIIGSKVQIELLKGIKRNGAARSLRAALKRFAQLAHFIRPHQGKKYVTNLFSILIKVSERPEEQIHETLAAGIQPIMKVLGCFASDNEIKGLLKSFLKNVTNTSPAIRRAATSTVIHVCLNCRKPDVFISYVTNYLLDLLVPVSEKQSGNITLGVITSLKHLIPHFNFNLQNDKNTPSLLKSETTSISIDRLLQIYELCLHYLSSTDHNVVNAALETLNSLLINCSDELKQILLSRQGIDRSRISLVTSSSLSALRSPSQLSVATNAATDDLFVESELTDTLRSDIEKWIDQSKLSVLNVPSAKSNDLESISLDSKSSSIETSLSRYDSFDYKVGYSSQNHSIGDNVERLTLSDNSSEKSFSYIEDDKQAVDVAIGSLLDDDVPLLYCARLIAKSFLLSGQVSGCVSDKSVRVSVKSLALTCMSSIVQIHPRVLTLYLDKNRNKSKKGCQQLLSDIILYESHGDPQLRGIARLLLANFISAVLEQGSYERWISENCHEDPDRFRMGSLLDVVMKGLEDESWSCTKYTISSLKTCMERIVESTSNEYILPVLEALPLVAANPYWLVKVTLCDLIATLPFVTIYDITGSNSFQKRIVDDVLFHLLRNEDARVRNGAANAIVRIVPQLYFQDFQPNHDPIVTKAIAYKNKFLSNLGNIEVENDLARKHLVENMPFPFCEILKTSCDRTEFALSKIVTRLFSCVLTATSNHFIFGCIEALSLLSEVYPTTLYCSAWNCRKSSTSEDVTLDWFGVCAYLLTHSVINYDLSCHANLLRLSSNLYAGLIRKCVRLYACLGFSLSLLRPVSEVETSAQAWDMFANSKFSKLADHYLHHLVKILNVFHYVLDEACPTQPKAGLANLSSPIKRRKSDLDKKLLSPSRTPEKDDKDKKDGIGSFVHLPYYMKIYDVLRLAYSNYKVTLEAETSEKFLALLKQTLQSLSVFMEVATLVEFQAIAEEILNYCRYTFVLEASATVECVQQLLKYLLGNNLATSDIHFCTKSYYHESLAGFYHNIIQKPFSEVAACFNTFKNVQKVDRDGDNTLMGYLHRRESKPILVAPNSDKILANYIRIFEPMVIKSLNHYTITSDVKLQCKVLQLLNQLIQLRVNYCLLDSEQVFIRVVLKQFEYIEEGQMPFAHELVEKIFQFLVQVSHSKQHSKSIITVPKIIQLCDGLSASGQSLLTHCIPALEPLVENIFLTRSKLSNVDAKELETTRDVVLSMLLRLCEFHQVIDLIVLILDDSKYCSNDPDKWSRWSTQVVNVILPMLRQNKIRLDDAQALVSVRKLVFVLEPSVFNPCDGVLLVLFQEELSFEKWQDDHARRLAKIITCLLVLSPINEELLIGKIDKLKAEFAACSIFDRCTSTPDPLNVLNSVFNGVAPELIYVRFLFKTILLASCFCAKNDFVAEELAVLLLYCVHVLQSESNCKIAQYAIDNRDSIHLEEISSNLCAKNPLLTCLWCYVLTLLNYNDQKFWMRTIDPSAASLNGKIVSTGALILFCDYLNQDVLTQQASWFLRRHIVNVVDLCEEDPIFEFICSVHRNTTTSKCFVDSLNDTNPSLADPVFVLKILKSVENTHPDHTGPLVKLLLPRLLQSKELFVARQVASLASRKLELLLTMTVNEVNEQLSKSDLLQIIRSMATLNLVRKHEALASLLNKLCTQFFDVSPWEFDQKRCVRPEQIKTLQIDKQWYLGQVGGKETAKLLCRLDYDELRSFMSRDFPKSVIKDCIRLGLSESDAEPSSLIKASVDYLLQEVETITRSAESSDVFEICATVSYYVDVVHRSNNKVTDESLVKFGVLCLKSIVRLISDKNAFNVNCVTSALCCAQTVLSKKDLSVVLEEESNISQLCSAVNCLYNLVEFLCKEPLPSCDEYNLGNALERNKDVGVACHQLYILLTWLYKSTTSLTLAKFLFQPIRTIIVTLARLSVFNSYMLIPVQVWKSGWEPKLLGNYNTLVPPLPIEFLQEIDVLEEFIFRTTLLGWTSRQQFEETWMCLLSVLCSNSSGKDAATVQEIVHASSLAVKAITALLLQSLYVPTPGHTNASNLIHVSRYAPVSDGNKSAKLRAIQSALEKKHAEALCLPVPVNIFKHSNFEKRSRHYSYGQVSVEYLLLATGTVNVGSDSETSKIWQRKESLLESSGLDINSCLQFLLDYYTQHLKNESSTPLRFLHEIVRSTVIISDLFTDKLQFGWMLEVFMELSKTHTVEDELLHQYLIIGISKSAAVLTPNLETYESIKKLLVQYLKSSFLPSRMSCLYGFLYILEGCKLSNISIGGISEEMQVILPSVVEYVQCNLNSSNAILRQSQEHTVLVWTLAFFLMESVDESHLEPNFVTNTLHAAFTVLLQQKPTNTLQLVLLKAIERLVATRKIMTKNIGKQVLSLALDRIKSENPNVSLLGIQLLLTYMYTDYSEPETGDSQTNPDHLVQTVEKISAVFEHIKRGHVFEVEILCHVLPQILNDFFSPADILTKVIGEFLSPQQPHPKFLSGVVFQVFERAIEDNQLPLLQDWVVFSLSNFTQSLSVGMATWCLTCFFISASSNKWLRFFFPYVQTRVGRYEYEDRKMLCIAGSDFYKNLSNKKQKETFVENFRKIKDQLDTLFNDLLSSL